MSKYSLTVFFIALLILSLVGFKSDWLINYKTKELAYYNKGVSKIIPEVKSGYVKKGFYLKYNALEKGDVYFSTDGSLPNKFSHPYNGNIFISEKKEELSRVNTSKIWKVHFFEGLNDRKALTVRAALNSNGNKYSFPSNQTYFFSNNYNLPVVSIMMEPEHLISENKGIYVFGETGLDSNKWNHKPWWDKFGNYSEKGFKSERRCYVQFFDENLVLQSEGDFGVRINGNATRAFPQKSLRIKKSKVYSKENIKFNFENSEIKEFDQLVLRNSGNDWGKTIIADGVMQSLLSDFEIDKQFFKASVVFINGEYWGIHNARTKFNDNLLADLNQVTTKEVLLLEGNGEIKDGNEKFYEHFNKLQKAIRERNVQNALASINLESFYDYIIAQTYFANQDWPNNNHRFYVLNENGKKTVKWVVFDLDYGFGYLGRDQVNTNMFNYLKSHKNTFLFKLFNLLMSDTDLKEQFKKRYALRLKNDFTEEKLLNSINEFKSSIQSEIKYHINRWRYPSSESEWKNNINDLEFFALNRTQVVKKQLDKW